MSVPPNSKPEKKITTLDIRLRKEPPGGKLVAITAYDFTFAQLVDEWVDIVLVGDSLGMVIQGEPNTLSVTVDQMIYHSRAVSRALHHAHLVVDMPFMSYQHSIKSALKNAGRLLSEGRGEAVKLEGGVGIARTVERLVLAGIPVMGHIGLTPQSVHAFGGYRVQGKTEAKRHSLLEDAVALAESGAYAMVLEGMPSDLAAAITGAVKIPTIGIGAGPACDGQVLVSQDLLGLNPHFSPRFVKRYATLAATVKTAVDDYAREVREGTFPGPEHSF